MGGAQVLLKMCVLILLQRSGCTQVTIPVSDLSPVAQGALSSALHLQQHWHYCLWAASAQRVSVARPLDGKAGKMHVLHMCPPNLSRSEFHLPCGWVPLGFRKPSLPQQVWDSSPKGWLWNRWNTFCDFGPKQHSKFGMNMSFGTNPKLSVWGSWLDLWVGFLVGWAGLGVLVVFYQ